MENLKFTLHELMTLITIIVSVTTAYMLLNNEVQLLKDNVRWISGEVEQVKKSTEQIKTDQLRTNILLNHLYGIDAHDTLNGPLVGKTLPSSEWYHESNRGSSNSMIVGDKKK